MARQKRTDGYADRIKAALEMGPRPMSVRELAKRLGEKHPQVRGVSYGGVRQYVEGKVANPRTEFLRALADVLGVRWQRIAYGEGPWTDAELAERAEVEGVGVAAGSRKGKQKKDPLWEQAFNLKWDVLEGMGLPAYDLREPLDNYPQDGKLFTETMAQGEAFRRMEAWADLVNIHHIPHWVAPIAEVKRRLGITGREIGSALQSTLTGLGIESGALSEESRADFITAMIPVMLSLAAERRRLSAGGA
jgi:transcriptional regulator with XRE-family HTH domain